MAIALFGGSFDPPHIGHLAVVRTALQTLPITRLFVVPTSTNPFKDRSCASAKRRLAWLQTIFADTPKVTVSDFEVRQQRPVPTIETVRHLRGIDPDLFLIIGADNLPALPKWHAFAELNRSVTWVVATRDDHPVRESILQLRVEEDVSSTQLRDAIEREKLPEPVRQEIETFYKEHHCSND